LYDFIYDQENSEECRCFFLYVYERVGVELDWDMLFLLIMGKKKVK